MKKSWLRLERTLKPSINRAAQTLLDLCETWENTTQEVRRDLVHIMIQEVGVDVEIKRVLWVIAQDLFEQSLSIDTGLQFWYGIADALHALGDLYFQQGNQEAADCYYQESRAMQHEHALSI